MAAPQWDYSAINGQHKWVEHCKISGNRQSPIDIIHDQTVHDSNLQTLKFHSNKCSFELLNKGVNVSFTPVQDKDNLMQISSGPLDGVYDFKECHFHWSRDNTTGGSEHLLNGNQAQAELHLVHFKHDVNQPLETGDGLCVLGIRLVCQKDAPTDPMLKHLLNLIPKVAYKGDQSKCENQVALYEMLNNIREKYYTYDGSLTTPPLAECVKWIVFSDVMTISEDDFNHFHSVFAIGKGEDESAKDFYDPFSRSGDCRCHGKPKIRDNYRDVCDLSGRQVRRSFK